MAHVKAVIESLLGNGPVPGPPDPQRPKCRLPWFCTCGDVIFKQCTPGGPFYKRRPGPLSMRRCRSTSPAPSEASTMAPGTLADTISDTSSVTGLSVRARYSRSRSPARAQKTAPPQMPGPIFQMPVQPKRPLHPDERPASRSHENRPGQNTLADVRPLLTKKVLNLERTRDMFKEILEDDRISVNFQKNTDYYRHAKKLILELPMGTQIQNWNHRRHRMKVLQGTLRLLQRTRKKKGKHQL